MECGKPQMAQMAQMNSISVFARMRRRRCISSKVHFYLRHLRHLRKKTCGKDSGPTRCMECGKPQMAQMAQMNAIRVNSD
jgi:hypothetical protein